MYNQPYEVHKAEKMYTNPKLKIKSIVSKDQINPKMML